MKLISDNNFEIIKHKMAEMRSYGKNPRENSRMNVFHPFLAFSIAIFYGQANYPSIKFVKLQANF